MIVAVLRRDLAVLWQSPLPYVTAAAVHAATGLLVVGQLELRRQAVLGPLVPVMGLLLLVAAAIVTRGLAADAESGQLDLLASVPVPGRAVAVGAWLSGWLTLLAVLAPSGVLVLLVAVWGDPDPGATAAGFVGLALLAAAAAGIGVLVATLVRSAVTATGVTLLVLLVSWFLPVGPASPLSALAGLSLSERVRVAASGGLDVGAVAFLVAVVLLCLVVSASVLDRPRRRIRGDATRPAVVRGAVVLLAVLGVVLLDAQAWVVDLTASDALTLQPATLDVLASVEEPTEITAFLPAGDPTYDLATGLLQRYADRNSLVRVRVLDPDEVPGEVRRLQADLLGPLVVAQGDRLEHAPSPIEVDVTAALARVVRGEVPQVCFTTGHGEAELGVAAADGLSSLGQVLAEAGMTTTSIDLLAAAAVDGSCDVVVVAGPREQLGASADTLAAWLDTGGRLLLLADPVAPVDAAPVLAPHGLALDRGIVIEGDPAAHLPDDPSAPIITRYSAAHPVVRALSPMLLPGVQGVLVADDTDVAELFVSRLADTSPASHLEREPLTAPEPDPEVDVLGPITVAAAAERVLDGGTRSRVVVVGDVDVATDAGVLLGANASFLLQAVTWLADAGDLIVSPNLPRSRPLELTSARLTYARTVTAGVVPVLFLLAGATTWAVRRRR